MYNCIAFGFNDVPEALRTIFSASKKLSRASRMRDADSNSAESADDLY
jgi:hypothetical protein